MTDGGPTTPAADPGPNTSDPVRDRERRRVLLGTLVGTTIEWYDFLIYAQAAGIVLADQYLRGAQGWTQVAAWATVGISFLFRPLGATLAGHLGDRLGRKAVLVYTLIGMGVATSLIGVLPGHSAIGAAAPILLIVLRILQGLFAGGEWGGAALMSVEHAPRGKRALYGSFPQVGVPLGLALATAVMLGVSAVIGVDAYRDWGWRIPFLLSVALILVGWMIRRNVDESPVFVAMRAESKLRSAPILEIARRHPLTVIKGAFIFAGHQATGYLVIAFFGSYAVKTLGMSQGDAYRATLIAGLVWTGLIFVSGFVADRIGIVRTFVVGYVLLILWVIPMWSLIDSRDAVLYTLAIVILTLPLALTLGPLPALFAPLFPAEVRFSGVSLAYAIGAILGGAFAPMIAQIILDATGDARWIGVYIIALSVPAFLALFLVPRGIDDVDLGVGADAGRRPGTGDGSPGSRVVTAG